MFVAKAADGPSIIAKWGLCVLTLMAWKMTQMSEGVTEIRPRACLRSGEMIECIDEKIPRLLILGRAYCSIDDRGDVGVESGTEQFWCIDS
jgi:hypothetical protein